MVSSVPAGDAGCPVFKLADAVILLHDPIQQIVQCVRNAYLVAGAGGLVCAECLAQPADALRAILALLRRDLFSGRRSLCDSENHRMLLSLADRTPSPPPAPRLASRR